MCFNILSTVFLIVIFGCVSSAVENEKSQELKAQQIWEQSLVAKGGRERLYSVRNMVISSSGSKEKSSIRFNVEYNEKIFTNPPSIEAGHKAWMKGR